LEDRPASGRRLRGNPAFVVSIAESLINIALLFILHNYFNYYHVINTFNRQPGGVAETLIKNLRHNRVIEALLIDSSLLL
jgi:hypothetical protein